MCKCVLHSLRMKEILAKFFNMIIERKYYPKRQKKILDVIIEKGKGPILGKLRIMQLIDADIQILIRICIGKQNDNSIENNGKFSKYNCSLRKRILHRNCIIIKEISM